MVQFTSLKNRKFQILYLSLYYPKYVIDYFKTISIILNYLIYENINKLIWIFKITSIVIRKMFNAYLI